MFRGSLGDLNASINRFHDGRDYHAATANPEPIAVTEGPTHAHTRLYTTADGGILLSLIDPAHDGGNGFSFESVEGDPLGVVVVPTQERITLTIPSAGALASAILAAFNADDALEASYFGTEDGSTNVLHSRFGRHEMLGGLDATEIEVLYAPEATGGISDADTMGDVKTVWDAGDGRLSFYYNGADANTVASRLTPWEHEFEDGETDTISLAGFGLGSGAERVHGCEPRGGGSGPGHLRGGQSDLGGGISRARGDLDRAPMGHGTGRADRAGAPGEREQSAGCR